MRCSTSAPRKRAALRTRRCLAAFALLSALVASGLLPRPVQAQPSAEIVQMELEREKDGLYLTAQMRFDLPPIVEDALEKGIPMFFIAEAALMRDRWFWTDKRVAISERYMRLAYLPLTRRWRLNVSSEPIGNAGLGVSLTHHYELLDEALAAISRISHWKIAEAQDVERDARHWVEFGFRLDLSQLPRPFQIGAVGQGEWNLSTARSLQLPPEPRK